MGRLKDMLKVGGENVAAAEMERPIHPSGGQARPGGRRPGSRVSSRCPRRSSSCPRRAAHRGELVAFCTGKISSFKVPRYVRFVAEWPMSATKIQKFRLRDAFLTKLGR